MRRRTLIVLIITVLTTGLFLYQVISLHSMVFKEGNSVNETGASVKEQDIVIRNGSPDCNQLTFSCNVDWGEENIPAMLEIFRENKIKVTFFVSGRWAENHPDLLKQMYLEGHEIQSHGYGHKLCTQVSVDTTKEEILKTEAVILKVLSIKTTVFAPPSGDFDETTVELCRNMGYKLALWSSDTIDWREGSTADVIKERILKKPLKGAIVLMHPKSETVKALPGLIKEIKAQDIEIVPLYRLTL